ncbi:MAG: hypothetical protein A2017_20175 [Lentisphaerae bacterium GWF2_44_16]|nr:MAG: hypothetical protein A2017_20175 [Lentisphaerae bacterium GWF2_44_16]
MKVQVFLRIVRDTLCGGRASLGEGTLLSILNAYLCYYTVSAIAGIFCTCFGWTVSELFLSFSIMLFSFVVLLLFLSPRVPKRFFLMPILYIPTAIVVSLQFFLLSEVNSTLISVLFSAFQFMIGILMLLLIRTCCGAWLLRVGDLNSNSFSRAYLLRLSGGMALIIIIFISAMFGMFMFAVRHYSSDFIRVTPASIKLANKTFEKGGKRVILFGMSHIAGKDFYEGLKEKFPSRGTIILSEGTSDKKNLIKEESDYKGMATLIGGVMQPSKFSDTIVHRNADMDVSDFSSETIDSLNLIMKFHSLLDRKIDRNVNIVKIVILLLKECSNFSRKISKDTENSFLVEDDMITKRNEHLMKEILSALVKYDTVIVPWGVWHMPGVEQMLKKRGFICKDISYSSLF